MNITSNCCHLDLKPAWNLVKSQKWQQAGLFHRQSRPFKGKAWCPLIRWSQPLALQYVSSFSSTCPIFPHIPIPFFFLCHVSHFFRIVSNSLRWAFSFRSCHCYSKIWGWCCSWSRNLASVQCSVAIVSAPDWPVFTQAPWVQHDPGVATQRCLPLQFFT